MKKKKILQILLAGAAACVCMVSAVFPASAARPHENAKANCRLYDPDGMFDEADTQSINELIAHTSEVTDMYIAVYVLDESGAGWSDHAVEVFADDTYDQLFNVQYGEESDGVMLMFDEATRYAYITTCGMGQLYYYNGAENDRISEMISHMVGQDVGTIVTRFCQDADYYYKKGLPSNAYTYNRDNGEYIYQYHGEVVHSDKLPWWFGVHWGFLAPLAAVIGGLTALISYLIIKNAYQLKKSLDATNYISDKETHFYVQDDIFLRQHTTKTYHDPNRGSGGGGGGGGSSHMSSGGFSHGGGGGHV